MFRIGEGYDVHKLATNRKLILGGVEIQYEKGLIGHSDADVLTHSIIDSLFGAMALGDIGKHFPDTNEEFKNANSLKLLVETKKIILSELLKKAEKFEICNIDSTIICESPKLRPYIDDMRKNIANALDIDLNKISIKATTEEGLGFTGNGDGIASKAITLIEIKE